MLLLPCHNEGSLPVSFFSFVVFHSAALVGSFSCIFILFRLFPFLSFCLGGVPVCRCTYLLSTSGVFICLFVCLCVGVTHFFSLFSIFFFLFKALDIMTIFLCFVPFCLFS